MFESALGRSEASSSRFGTGAILSAVVHGLFAALVLVIPGKTKAQQEEQPEPLVIQIAQPKVVQGGSPAPAQPEAKPTPAPRPKAAVRIPDKPTPEPTPQQPEAPTPEAPAQTESAGPPGGGESGPPGGGTGTGTGTGPGTGDAPSEAPKNYEIPWNATMERPVLLSGPAQPEYPRDALLQHREDTVLVKCRITTDGAVRDCSIIKGDVMLQQASLDALAKQRYRPLLYGGNPVSVWYTFRFTFKLQR